MATVNPRDDSVSEKTVLRASVVPEITTVSNPKSRPPRAATSALPIRVPVSDAGAGGAAMAGRVSFAFTGVPPVRRGSGASGRRAARACRRACEQTNAATSLACRLIASSGRPARRPTTSAAVKASPAPTVSLHFDRHARMVRPGPVCEQEAPARPPRQRHEREVEPVRPGRPSPPAPRPAGRTWPPARAIPGRSASGRSPATSESSITTAIDERCPEVHVEHPKGAGACRLHQRADRAPRRLVSLRQAAEADGVGRGGEARREGVGLDPVPGGAGPDRVARLAVGGQGHIDGAGRPRRGRPAPCRSGGPATGSGRGPRGQGRRRRRG